MYKNIQHVIYNRNEAVIARASICSVMALVTGSSSSGKDQYVSSIFFLEISYFVSGRIKTMDEIIDDLNIKISLSFKDDKKYVNDPLGRVTW